MARPKEFDKDEALAAAVNVFRKHGFAGASTAMLTQAMRIGKQSLYDTFGDKWRLYCSSLERYVAMDTLAHLDALRGGSSAIEGLRRMVERVTTEAPQPCLAIGSISEFGREHEDLTKIHDAASRRLRKAMVAKIEEAQAKGDIASDLDPEQVAAFLLANMAAIRLAARGGAGDAELRALGQLALHALR